MLFRSKVILAKAEVTYDTDPTPVGTDGVLTKGLTIQRYAGSTVSRDNDRSTLGGETVINTNPHSIATFDVEIAGAGTAGDAPAWAPLLLACGFGETLTPATNAVYAPVSASWPSVTLYYYADGMLQKLTGCRGSVTFNLTKGTIPAMSFTLMGNYNTPTDAAVSGFDVTDYIAPIPVTDTNTPDFTIDAVALKADSLTLDLGNNVVPRNVINSREIIITDRGVTGNTVFEAVLPGTKDWFTDAIESHSGINTNVLALTHGTVSGNIIDFDAPAAQMTAANDADSDGLLTFSADLSLTPSSGNDELTLTVY